MVEVLLLLLLQWLACLALRVWAKQFSQHNTEEEKQRPKLNNGDAENSEERVVFVVHTVLRGFGKATSAVGCVVWEQVEIIRIPLSALSVDANLKHWHQNKKKAEDCWNWTGQETEPSQRQVWPLKHLFHSFYFFCKIVVYLMGEQINDRSLRRILLSFVPSPS